ncbi:hypothetical protein GCM10023205_53220 [Yinghuangia aomiensis]|uniref:Secreted protein n=1 Tax=Yinghuangia aomiensis TaxID=676205 RepID=A0ABP9HUE1_9ACTN
MRKQAFALGAATLAGAAVFSSATSASATGTFNQSRTSFITSTPATTDGSCTSTLRWTIPGGTYYWRTSNNGGSPWVTDRSITLGADDYYAKVCLAYLKPGVYEQWATLDPINHTSWGTATLKFSLTVQTGTWAWGQELS